MTINKPLYEVQYYETRPNDWQHNRRKKLVFAKNRQAAKRHVASTVENFEGFPTRHETARVVRKREYEIA